MKVLLVGGGIASLSTAFYIKKLALPVSQIIIVESSDRLGGWINSEKIFDKENNRNIIFESAARIFRYKPLQRRELNTLNLASELGISDEIEYIPDTHIAAKNRFVFSNGKLNSFNPNVTLGKKDDTLASYFLYNELKGIPRASNIKDESIYDFMSRRFGSDFTEKIVDPYFNSICYGDIKELSSYSLLKGLYSAESKYGSITKGYMRGRKESRIRMKERFTNFSIYRFKNGSQTLTDALVNHLKQYDDIKFNTNEKCLSIDLNSSKIKVETDKKSYDVDLVISGVFSKYLGNMISSEKHLKLKGLLNKIDAVNMVVVNLYFDKNILPTEGFGYFVPKIENSPILSCLFDSVFDQDNKNHSTLTVMMGGSRYDEYFNEKLVNDSNKLLEFTLNSLKKQIKFDINPKSYKVSVLKNCYPQYKIGHESLVNEIDSYIKENKLSDKLYLIGSSYNGSGIKDVIYNSKTLCEKQLKLVLN